MVGAGAVAVPASVVVGAGTTAPGALAVASVPAVAVASLVVVSAVAVAGTGLVMVRATPVALKAFVLGWLGTAVAVTVAVHSGTASAEAAAVEPANVGAVEIVAADAARPNLKPAVRLHPMAHKAPAAAVAAVPQHAAARSALPLER